MAGRGRGFAGMDEDQQREIASMGGRAAHESGNAHEFDSEEAREAGSRGGRAAREAGRKGGKASHHSNAAFYHEAAAHHHRQAAKHHSSGNEEEGEYAHVPTIVRDWSKSSELVLIVG